MGACTSIQSDPPPAHAHPEPLVVRVQSASARAAPLHPPKEAAEHPKRAASPRLRQAASTSEDDDSAASRPARSTRTTSLGSSAATSSHRSLDSNSKSTPGMATLTPSDHPTPNTAGLSSLPSHHSAPGPSRPASLATVEPNSSPVLTPLRPSPTHAMLSPVPSERRRQLSLNTPPVRVPLSAPDLTALLKSESASGSPPALAREATPTVHTSHIESGVTEDGWYHINQYIVEMGKWKREAAKRASARALRRAERVAARARRAAEHGISYEASDDDDESSESEVEESPEEDSEEEATILGRGSYGTVKRVFNSQDGQFYAMKIMSKSLLSKTRAFGRQAGEGDGMDGVRREVAIMKRLQHPNIVKLVEVLCDEDDEDGDIYLVMEYMEKGPIMKVDLDDGEVEFEDGSVNIVADPLPVETARRYLHDILCGLDYLHHQRVIHRDIKPENLLLGSDDRVRIADFGVSTLCEGDECLISSTAGSGPFLSPEMIRSGSRNRGFGGPPTDVWSLGVTLFFMLYGRLPWYSRSLPEIYRMICEDPLVFPTGLEFAHIPVQAQTLVRYMLDKDPKKRATISCMLQCPWVTQGFTWNLESHCKEIGHPEAISYKHQQPVESTLCSTEIQQALTAGKVTKDVPVAATAEQCKCPIYSRIKSRLALWKADMQRNCAAKKAARAKKRATLQARLPSAVSTEQEALQLSIRNPRRATAHPGASYVAQ